MTDNDKISLRQHIEALFVERDKALDRQAREYERRLGELNNEHRRTEKVVVAAVTRAEWEQFQSEYRDRHRTLELDLSRTLSRGMIYTLITVLGLIIGGLSTIIQLSIKLLG